jgi:hypothetical protein
VRNLYGAAVIHPRKVSTLHSGFDTRINTICYLYSFATAQIVSWSRDLLTIKNRIFS